MRSRCARYVLAGSLTLALAATVGASGEAATPPAPKHPIGVRVVKGSGELFDRRTGKRFVPRGSNYVRLGPEGHATFTVGRYDAKRAGSALSRMRGLGYNTVRVFLGGDCAGCPGAPGGGISRAYARNVADFLRRAKSARQYVVLTTQWLPSSYGSLIGDSPLVDDVNRIYLTEGGIRAYATFWRDFVLELRRQRAPLDTILAYDVVNEAAFVVNQAPFTLTAGTLRAPGGKRYALADPAAKERLLGEGLIPFANRVRAAIRLADPTALVSASFFAPSVPNTNRLGDVRDLRTQAVISRSALDLVDVHVYPGGELSLAQHMENYGIAAPSRKPIVIGETGAFRQGFGTAALAAATLAEWQATSCRYGIDGWLLWTWDSDEQPELWNGLSESAAIAEAMAPKRRPNACAAPSVPRNLALGRPVTASGALAENPPALAVDGNTESTWVSSGGLPQWIEVDLGSTAALTGIELLVAQFPAGATVHRVWWRDAAGALHLLRELAGPTSDPQTLVVTPGQPLAGVRAVRVETLSSPSWAAWREIRVFGTPTAPRRG